MKIYYIDLSWQGAIMVVAESREQAKELIKKTRQGHYIVEKEERASHHDNDWSQLEEHEIVNGLTLTSWGDS